MVKTIDNIKALVIPSGSAKDDLERGKVAINYKEENDLNAPFLISGLGPDTNIALGYEERRNKRKLDFHENLYNLIMEKVVEGVVGVDINSTNSIENVLFTFPKGTIGKYVIFSYPLHLKRFQNIISKAKEKGKISKELEVTYVPTPQTLKHIIYEKLFAIKRKRDLERI